MMSHDSTMTEEFICSADSVPLLYQQALTLHRQNRLDDAKSLYRQVLALDPNHAGAWHFLGVIALIQNDFAQARETDVRVARTIFFQKIQKKPPNLSTFSEKLIQSIFAP